MPVYVIDTLKPKNNLDFAVVEAVDVAVEGYQNLADAVTHFATDTAIATINAALNDKADISALTETAASLQAQINAIEIGASSEAVVAPEVIAARIGADGTSYNTLKERLDSNDNSFNSRINVVASAEVENYTLSNKGANLATTFLSGLINSSGTIIDVSSWNYAIVPVTAGKEYYISTYSGATVCSKIFYDSNNDPVLLEGTTPTTQLQNLKIVIPAGVFYIGINAPVVDVSQIGVWESTLSYALDVENMADDIKNSHSFELTLSNNLYNTSLAMDKTLLSNITGQPATFNNSIVSGFFPIEEGKTYTITNGTGLYVSAALFYDSTKNVICCDDTYTGIPAPTGKVEVGGTKKVRTFKILSGSNIRYVCWYISRNENYNYYGEHDGLSGIIDYVQVNEGNVLLPFDTYAVGYDLIGEKIREQASDIYRNTQDINTLKLLPISSRVSFAQSGNDIQFRSSWNDTYDIAVRCSKNGSNNGSFNIQSYYLMEKNSDQSDMSSGTLFKAATDDIAPFNFDSSYIGANHGWSRLYILNSANHGLTEANIGETWTDSNGNELLIIKVPSESVIWVVIPSDDSTIANLGTGTIGSTMRLNERIVTISSSTVSQVLPATNHKSVNIYINGDNYISDDGVYSGEFIDVVETYDIIYVPAMMDKIRNNIGNNTNSTYYSDTISERYATVSIVYRFTERGAITVFESIDFAKDVKWRFAHFVQSGTIGNYAVVPNSAYSAPTLLDNNGIEISQDKWNDVNNPPARYYQYSDATLREGMCIGFNEEIGDAKPIIQKEMSTVGMYYGTSKKMYPYLSYASRDVFANENINAICYRVPIGDYDPDVSIGWYYINDDIYILIDVQKSVNKYVKLPEYMNGMKVEICESFGNIQLSCLFVGANGIKIITTNYGSAILKLTK